MEKSSVKEIEKLRKLLEKGNIPYEISVWFGAPQIFYPSKMDCVCDIVSHQYCYGYEKGLLEIMGLCKGDDVEGYLTAKEIYKRIKKHYKKDRVVM